MRTLGILLLWFCWSTSISARGKPLTGNVMGPDFLVTKGTRDLTLTCQVPDPSKLDRYAWFTPGHGDDTKRCNATQTGNVAFCTFQPRLEDDNQNVTCTAFDPRGNILLLTFYQVNLRYPPPSPPSLTQTNTAQQGDVITCTVSGGKPRVTNVTFHCQHPDLADREDDVSDDGTTVSSSITVNTSKASNQSLSCTCSAYWDPEPGLYPHMIPTVFKFSEPSPDTPSPVVIGGVIGAVAVVVIIVLIAVVMWRYRRGKQIHSRQNATVGENPQTTREHTRQRRPQQISQQPHLGQQQPHDLAAAVQEESHKTSQLTETGNRYDVPQPGQGDDGITYTELMTSSTAGDGTYLHPVNDEHEIPASH